MKPSPCPVCAFLDDEEYISRYKNTAHQMHMHTNEEYKINQNAQVLLFLFRHYKS